MALPSWSAPVAPKDAPEAIRDRIVAEIGTVMADEAVRRRVLEVGGGSVGSGPAELVALVGRGEARSGTLIRRMGLRPDRPGIGHGARLLPGQAGMAGPAGARGFWRSG